MSELKSTMPDDEAVSGVLGVYVEHLTPKIKSTVYKYLIFCKNRADTANLPFTVVTNDTKIQDYCRRIGIEEELVWRACDHLYIFTTSWDEVESEYLTQVLDAVMCDTYTVVNGYTPKEKGGQIDLEGLKFKQEDHKMGIPYKIKNFIRENPDPYPYVSHQPTVSMPPSSMASTNKVVTWYDTKIRLWTSIQTDGQGNQVGKAGYGMNKKMAEEDRVYRNSIISSLSSNKLPKLIKEWNRLSKLITTYAHRWGENPSARLMGWVNDYDDLKEDNPNEWKEYCKIKGYTTDVNAGDLLA